MIVGLAHRIDELLFTITIFSKESSRATYVYDSASSQNPTVPPPLLLNAVSFHTSQYHPDAAEATVLFTFAAPLLNRIRSPPSTSTEYASVYWLLVLWLFRIRLNTRVL